MTDDLVLLALKNGQYVADKRCITNTGRRRTDSYHLTAWKDQLYLLLKCCRPIASVLKFIDVLFKALKRRMLNKFPSRRYQKEMPSCFGVEHLE